KEVLYNVSICTSQNDTANYDIWEGEVSSVPQALPRSPPYPVPLPAYHAPLANNAWCYCSASKAPAIHRYRPRYHTDRDPVCRVYSCAHHTHAQYRRRWPSHLTRSI